MDQSMPAMRPMTVVAQDPAIRKGNGRILTAQIDIPAEDLTPGPGGYRVQVFDYDASTRTFYEPVPSDQLPIVNPTNSEILDDPRFHAQNVYALVMRTLWRFEFALGRRVSWGFEGHQLKIAPHAFADANAFFAPKNEALFFGYFQGKKGTVYSSLSHDVVVHETTHALLNGLRGHFVDASTPDQAAIHEGFADVVALLSVLSCQEVVEAVIDAHASDVVRGQSRLPTLVAKRHLTIESLKKSLLFGLAEEMGRELAVARGDALRRSVELEASPRWYRQTEPGTEYSEPHRRGEILAAAIMNAYLRVWHRRLHDLSGDAEHVHRSWVAEEAAGAAEYLLTMVIRAIDYTPPVHIDFRDYLAALLTADYEIHRSDTKYGFRGQLLGSFKAYGIEPPSTAHSGRWKAPADDSEIEYRRTRFASMQHDKDEAFRFVWENRRAVGFPEDAFTRILSVRPCWRANPDDGFFLQETVVECLQTIVLEAKDLKRLGIDQPTGMPNEQEVHLHGGTTLVFNERGQLKYAITKNLPDSASADRSKHSQRIQYLFDAGFYRAGASLRRGFSAVHRSRMLDQASQFTGEQW